ncbi:MAG: capsule assembly Wzi family protein [Balneolaceae bacterium]
MYFERWLGFLPDQRLSRLGVRGWIGEEYRSQESAVRRLDSSFAVWLLFLLTILALIPVTASTQTIPVGDLREEQIRLQQLLNDSLNVSAFTNRPVWNHVYDAYMDPVAGRPGWWNRRIGSTEEEFFLPESEYPVRFGIYEPQFRMTTNSRVPYGENNGAAWYGKGFNTELLGGFYLTSDYLTVSFRPQVSWQQNNAFILPRFIPRTSDGEVIYGAEAIHGRIDRPFRFGEHAFTTADIGHSSIRFHYDWFEMGISSEPLWWGGSNLYPLMMSNNAPGMTHTFIGTRSPLQLPILGELEFRWMIGSPQDSDYFDLGEPYDRRRLMNAANISFSPEFVPGLHLGLTRAYHFYEEEEGMRWKDLFVIFDPFQKNRLVEKRGEDSVRKERNQLASLYARWVMPEHHLEIFGEFFREDHSWNWRDFLMQPNHNSGWSFGFQNLIFPPDWNWMPEFDFLKFHFEFTQLTPSRLDELRNQTYYYSHSQIRQGHTNRGQVLGAAIGPGSNSIYGALDLYKGDTTVGLVVQRWVDNDHFHFEYNQPRGPRFHGDKWRHRVNLDIGSRFVYGPGPWYLTGKVTWTQLFNYGRFDYGIYDGIDWDTRELDDSFNLQIQLSVRYVF